MIFHELRPLLLEIGQSVKELAHDNSITAIDEIANVDSAGYTYHTTCGNWWTPSGLYYLSDERNILSGSPHAIKQFICDNIYRITPI
jgi:hypothetical protein